ncbi:MAG: hypothetical protein J5585_08835 [Clostridia bacterium]|nr:hypothetical protein [Clostridia bacterium]
MGKKRIFKMIPAALALALLCGASSPALANSEKTITAAVITDDDRRYGRVTSSESTYVYGFSQTDVTFYSSDAALSTSGLRTGMEFDGQTLSCKPGKKFSFGSARFLGDDYGLYGGDASFSFALTGGTLAVGVRLSASAGSPDRRGVWFTFDGKSVTVTEPESRLRAVTDKAISSGTVTVTDRPELIELSVDGETVCRVSYDGYSGALAVSDGAGKTLAKTDSSGVRAAGYFTIYADGLEGKIDDVSFEHNDLSVAQTGAKGSAIDYSTWIATDDRGRTTPVDVDLREGKQVGIFYFLCHGGEDTDSIHDNTKIYTESGLEGLIDHLSDPKRSGSYYWAEPYFGYYTSVDKWVYRKHAAQLAAAGVDFIFLDFTNGAYYPEALQTLLDTWLQIRKEGGSTPQICVFCGGSYNAVMGALKGFIYSPEKFEKYGELFYQYKGKPLVLANVGDGDQSDLAKWIRETFTVRSCWAWQDQDGCWNWLQEYRRSGAKYRVSVGGLGRDADGNFEQLALCVGHHPTTSKGRSYANGKLPKINGNDFGFSLDSGAGVGFASQFDAVMYFDPDLVMITGWNEWIAGLSHYNEQDTFAGSDAPGFQFVDQFNTEYSRDAEPMRMRQGDGVGFGDNFYYQMAGYIRTYKGTGSVSRASGQTAIDLTDDAAWNGVGPVYGDTPGDTEWRSEDGYFTGTNYVNNSGRNDLISAKVSQDAEYLYFRVTAAENIVTDNGRNWMNLFVDIDGDASTGWEGFDLVLNRSRDGHYVSVESLADGWNGVQAGQALYTLDGDSMTVRLSKAVSGVEGKVSRMRFKWADNSTLGGNIMEFDDLGDAAPDGRFAYLYVCDDGGEDQPSISYKLISADGTEAAARDEKTPLPENGGNGAPQTTDGRQQGGEKTARRYSPALKAAIVATGAVAGACLFCVIALPTLIKRKKQNG